MISPPIGPAGPNKRRGRNARMAKPSSCKVVLSIPRSDRTEVPNKVNVRSDTSRDRSDAEGAMPSARDRLSGRARDAGSRAHMSEYSTEIQCGACGGSIKKGSRRFRSIRDTVEGAM